MVQNVVNSFLSLTVTVAAAVAPMEWGLTQMPLSKNVRPSSKAFNVMKWHKLQLNKPRSVEKFCDTLIPPFGVHPQKTKSPYKIDYSRHVDRVYVRIIGNDIVKWRGFVLQIRHNGVPVGRFYIADFLNDSKTYRFGCRPDIGPTHFGYDTLYRFAPNYLRKVFVWWLTPPAWTYRNYNYTLHATIIREYPTFWLHTTPLVYSNLFPYFNLSKVENDPLITKVNKDEKKEEFSWSIYLKFALLDHFRKALEALRLWEPGLVDYDATHGT